MRRGGFRSAPSPNISIKPWLGGEGILQLLALADIEAWADSWKAHSRQRWAAEAPAHDRAMQRTAESLAARGCVGFGRTAIRHRYLVAVPIPLGAAATTA